jgi:hypothetical protein
MARGRIAGRQRQGIAARATPFRIAKSARFSEVVLTRALESRDRVLSRRMPGMCALSPTGAFRTARVKTRWLRLVDKAFRRPSV